MKNNILKFCVFALSVLVIFSCGTEERQILTDAFVGLDNSATAFTYESFGTGQTAESGFKAALIAPAQSNDVTVTFEIVADSSSAIESLHYVVNGNTATIPAGSFTADLPVTINPDNIEIGESLTLFVRITDGGGVPVAPNFQEVLYTFDVTCPLDADMFVGNYTLNYVVAQFPFGPETFGPDGSTVVLNNVTGAASKRDFNFTYLAGGNFGNGQVPFRFNLLCGQVIPDSEQGTGLACTSGFDITLGPAASFSPFSPADDSVIDIIFEEFVTDGDCGIDPVTQSIRLTKQ